MPFQLRQLTLQFSHFDLSYGHLRLCLNLLHSDVFLHTDKIGQLISLIEGWSKQQLISESTAILAVITHRLPTWALFTHGLTQHLQTQLLTIIETPPTLIQLYSAHKLLLATDCPVALSS